MKWWWLATILLPNFGSELHLTHHKTSLCLSQRLHLLSEKWRFRTWRLSSVLSLSLSLSLICFAVYSCFI
jgi:hypothetical protein